MSRKKNWKQKQPRSIELTVKNPNAAGMDIGSRFHCVAVPPDRDAEHVRTFGVYTPDLHEMAAWLKACGISTVAMEATGVYWVPPYEILQQEGFEVLLVNPQFVKRMRDPKSDVDDSLLLLQLHTFGQLPASFRPDLDISVLQTYWRQRQRLVEQSADTIKLMHKAIELMNLHLHKAISDVSGVTGMRIVRAILGGQYNPEALADMKESGIKASREELISALTGNYRREHVFSLKVAVAQYDFLQEQIQECDRALSEFTATLPDGPTLPTLKDNGAPGQQSTKKKPKSRGKGNQPKLFDLGKEVERLTGRDWSMIPALGAMTIMTGIAEVGMDLTRWADEDRFSSWLTLAPCRKITGGRVISSQTRRSNNRFATALRIAATSLWHSDSALGAELRLLRGRLGPAKAITAMAHKLAILYYRMMRYGSIYVDIGQEAYEAKHRERTVRYIKRQADKLGLQVLEPAQAA